jgi:6-phosphogluconolactonase
MPQIQEIKENIASNALEKLKEAIELVLKEKANVNIGIPGGNSVKELFSLLKHETNLPWDRIQIFMVDERMVSITNPESNYRNAHSSFISVLTEKEILPEENVHAFFLQEFKNQAKRNYDNEIEQFGGMYDIVILGVGADGHIASLFPNKDWGENEEYTILVNDAPEPLTERISISKKMLLKAKSAFLFFIGDSKKEAFEKFNDKKIPVEDCPAKLVKKIENVYVFTDIE